MAIDWHIEITLPVLDEEAWIIREIIDILVHTRTGFKYSYACEPAEFDESY